MEATLKIVCLLAFCYLAEPRPSMLDPPPVFSDVAEKGKTVEAQDLTPAETAGNAAKAINSQPPNKAVGTMQNDTGANESPLNKVDITQVTGSGVDQNGSGTGTKPGNENGSDASKDNTEGKENQTPVGNTESSALQSIKNNPVVGDNEGNKESGSGPTDNGASEDKPEEQNKDKTKEGGTDSEPSTDSESKKSETNDGTAAKGNAVDGDKHTITKLQSSTDSTTSIMKKTITGISSNGEKGDSGKPDNSGSVGKAQTENGGVKANDSTGANENSADSVQNSVGKTETTADQSITKIMQTGNEKDSSQNGKDNATGDKLNSNSDQN